MRLVIASSAPRCGCRWAGHQPVIGSQEEVRDVRARSSQTGLPPADSGATQARCARCGAAFAPDEDGLINDLTEDADRLFLATVLSA